MQARSKTMCSYQDVCFHDEQKFQHFLKNFGIEFLININLDDEILLNYKDKNPIDWAIQLKNKQKQITIQNISKNITHIISLLDQNAAGRSSPEIEMSQNNGVTVSSPKKSNFGLGMHTKIISQCQDSGTKTDEELSDSDCAQKKQKTLQMRAVTPPHHHQKTNCSKNLPPLKIKIQINLKPNVKKRNQHAKQKARK